MDFLNASGALALFGYFGYMLKDIPNKLWSIIVPRFTTTLEWDNTQSGKGAFIFRYANKWLTSVDKSAVIGRHVDESIGLSNAFEKSTIADGSYYLWPSRTCLMVVSARTQRENINDRFAAKFVTVTIYGFNQRKLKDNFYNYIKSEREKDNNKSLWIRVMNGMAYTSNKCCKRQFESVFTKHNAEIKRILDNFMVNRDFYREHGLAHKTGILLYGPPGSGKSSLVRAIATYINWSITYVDPCTDDPSGGDNEETIILFEDIDCAEPKRNERVEAGMSLKKLLNYIDGPLTPSDVIFIATTNHIEDLDPALIRRGRFDHHFEIGYADRDDGEAMCRYYGAPLDVLDDIEFPTSPAVIQNEILYRKTSKSVDDNIDELADIEGAPVVEL